MRTMIRDQHILIPSVISHYVKLINDLNQGFPFFTESTLRSILFIIHDICLLCVCLSVCAIVENRLPGGLMNSGRKTNC